MSVPLKVVTILGTRPEIIRLSATISALDAAVNHVLVHTGQNFDYELNEVFFGELGVRQPDHFLAVDASKVGRAYGQILERSEAVLEQEHPDAVLVLGDTNSAISAIVAKRMHIPVFHMEAGNRSFDDNVPEEVNRRIVDHTADVNLVYTERARQHLLSEGLAHRRIYLTGSPLREVLETHRQRIEESDVLARLDLRPGGFFLVSMHREENVDDPSRLRAVITCLNRLARHFDNPVLVSTHPRTRRQLETVEVDIDTRIRFAKPFGFLDYNKLQIAARCVVSDSGSISEESAILGFPAVTLRDSMERPEAIDAGSIVIAGLQSDYLVEAVQVQLVRKANGPPSIPDEYTITDTSARVVAAMVSLARLSNRWSAVRDLHPSKLRG